MNVKLVKKKIIHKIQKLCYTITYKEVDMSKKSIIEELEKNKNEACDSLHAVEVEVGHYIFKKKDKAISKENVDEYISFNTVIESLHEEKNTIITLDTEVSEARSSILLLKETKAIKEKELFVMQAEMGELLFKNYSPIIADIFGKTYTDVSVEDRKILEANEKGFSKGEESSGFMSRVLNMARSGVAKTQLSLIEQRRSSLLHKGAKKALESNELKDIILANQLGEDTKKFYEEYVSVQSEINEITENLDNQLQHEKSLRASIEKVSGGLSVQKQLALHDKQIERKYSEQDDFCASIGHDYATRYVSPDGETLAVFPKGFEGFLTNIQDHRYTILSLSRQIEIENTKIAIAELVSENNLLQSKKEDNSQKIESLQVENAGFDATIKEKNKEKIELEKKLDELVTEESKSKQTES